DGVTAFEGEAKHLRLNRGAIRKTQIVDGVHQLRREFEIVEASLAFGGLDHEVFQLPGWCGWLWWLAGTRSPWFGGGFGVGLNLRLGAARLVVVAIVRRRFGSLRTRLRGRVFAKDLLECFEHGLLVVDQEIRRPV